MSVLLSSSKPSLKLTQKSEWLYSFETTSFYSPTLYSVNLHLGNVYSSYYTCSHPAANDRWPQGNKGLRLLLRMPVAKFVCSTEITNKRSNSPFYCILSASLWWMDKLIIVIILFVLKITYMRLNYYYIKKNRLF